MSFERSLEVTEECFIYFFIFANVSILDDITNLSYTCPIKKVVVALAIKFVMITYVMICLRCLDYFLSENKIKTPVV